MKKIFVILFALISTASSAQIPLAGHITTLNGDYPTHLDTLGMGGFVTVQDITSRNAITVLRRKPGMLAYVQADSSFYQLRNGITNSNWTQVLIGGGSGTTPTLDQVLTQGNTSTNSISTGSPLYVTLPSQGRFQVVHTGVGGSQLTALNGSFVFAPLVFNASQYIFNGGTIGTSNISTIDLNATGVTRMAGPKIIFGSATTPLSTDSLTILHKNILFDKLKGGSGNKYAIIKPGGEIDTTSAAPGSGGIGDTTELMRKGNNLADVASVPSARTNLGLGTAAVLDVAPSGNASSAQVVRGNDTRLTDSRTPTGPAGGGLRGSYPNPGINPDSINRLIDSALYATNNAVSNSIKPIVDDVDELDNRVRILENNTYYIDGIGGNDANDGKSTGRPVKTIAKLLTLNIQRNDNIFVARNSYFREELNLQDFDSLTIRDYGEGAKPIFDAADTAKNRLFVKRTATTNVYKINWTNNYVLNPSQHSVWEDGKRLIRATSLANCDAFPGSFFFSGITTGGTDTIYVHSSNNSNIITNGRLYEITKRDAGIVIGGACRVYNMHTRRNSLNNGSFWADGDNCYINGVIAEDGVKHNFFMQSGTAENCVTWKCDLAVEFGGQTMFVSYTPLASDTTDAIYKNCISIASFNDDPTSVFGAVGLYAHTGGGQYRNVIVDGGTYANMGVAIGGEPLNLTVKNAFIQNCYNAVLKAGNGTINFNNNTVVSILDKVIACDPTTLNFNQNKIYASFNNIKIIQGSISNINASYNTIYSDSIVNPTFILSTSGSPSNFTFKNNIFVTPSGYANNNNIPYLSSLVSAASQLPLINADSNYYQSGAYVFSDGVYSLATMKANGKEAASSNGHGLDNFFGVKNTGDYFISRQDTLYGKGGSFNTFDSTYRYPFNLFNPIPINGKSDLPDNLIKNENINAKNLYIYKSIYGYAIDSLGFSPHALYFDPITKKLKIGAIPGNASLTFTNGLTESAGTITNNLNTGINSASQTVTGSTQASGSLLLQSTSNATKGIVGIDNVFDFEAANQKLKFKVGLSSVPFSIVYDAVPNDYKNEIYSVFSGTPASNVFGFSMTQAGATRVPLYFTADSISHFPFYSNFSQNIGVKVPLTSGVTTKARDEIDINGTTPAIRMGLASELGRYHRIVSLPFTNFPSTNGLNFLVSTGTVNVLDTPMQLRGDNSIYLKSLRTTGVAPATTGTIKMNVTDAEGKQSFIDIPSGGISTDSILTLIENYSDTAAVDSLPILNTIQPANDSVAVTGQAVAAYTYDSTYTPTITNGTNVTASTAVICNYIKTGKSVQIDGTANVTVTTDNINSTISISLPIASDFTETTDGSGVVGSTNTLVFGGAVANVSSNLMDIKFISSTSGATTFTFHIVYRIK